MTEWFFKEMLLHLASIITIVRHVTGNDQDYLGESPEWLFRYLLLL
jgi:hypothetical protein